MTETRQERSARYQAAAAAALAKAEAQYVRAIAAANVATYNLAVFTGQQVTVQQEA